MKKKYKPKNSLKVQGVGTKLGVDNRLQDNLFAINDTMEHDRLDSI
jgi:hypothetical protein